MLKIVSKVSRYFRKVADFMPETRSLDLANSNAYRSTVL